MFGVESLLSSDQSKRAVLNILRVYVDKREQDVTRAFEICDDLVYNTDLRQELIDFISYKRHQATNHKLSTLDNLNRTSFCQPLRNSIIAADVNSGGISSGLRKAKSSSSLNSFVSHINRQKKQRSEFQSAAQLSDSHQSESLTKSNRFSYGDNFSLPEIDCLVARYFSARFTFTPVSTVLELF